MKMDKIDIIVVIWFLIIGIVLCYGIYQVLFKVEPCLK
jgi:hypothetical protein